MAIQTKVTRRRAILRPRPVPFEQLRQTLAERFSQPDPGALDHALSQIQLLFSALGRDPLLGEVSDLRILHVCCNPIRPAPQELHHAATIWACRALNALGSQAVLVHYEDLVDEPYDDHQLDLTSPHVLDFMPPESFDGIMVAIEQVDLAHPAELRYQESVSPHPSIDQQLAAEILRLAVDGGVVLWRGQLFRRHGDALVAE
jgi:hypothetical protein